MNFLKNRSYQFDILLIVAISFMLSFVLMVTHEVFAQGPPTPPQPPIAAPVIGISGGAVILFAMAAYGIYRIRKRRRRKMK